MRDDHFVSRCAVRNENWRIAQSGEAHSTLAGVGDPNRVASQMALLIDGAYATSLVAKPADLKGDLIDAAMKLLA